MKGRDAASRIREAQHRRRRRRCLVADVPLPGGASRFDYQSIDPARERLLIAHPGAGQIVAFGISDLVDAVANSSPDSGWEGLVIVDQGLNPAGSRFHVVVGNKQDPTAPEAVREIPAATVHELDGSTGSGPLAALPVTLAPLEAQVLGRPAPEQG